MSFLESNKKVFLILFSIYFLVNIPMLLNFNGIYWDDWTLVGHSLETLNITFFGAVGYSGYATSYLHYFMINELGIYSYRIFTFILLFLSGWFIFKILSTISIFSSQDRFFITILFLVAPLYSAKIALIDFPYTFYSFLFFLGFLILSSYIYRLNLFVRVMVLIIFFFSFFVNSLLVFYAVVLLYIFYKIYNIKLNFIQNSILFVKTKIDFIILPILFFIVKSIWFVSSGAHGSDYNKISIFAMLNPFSYLKSFSYSFVEPIAISFASKGFGILFVIIVFLMVFFRKKLNFSQNCEENPSYKLSLLFLGVIVFIFGAMPYIAVGKVPTSEDWLSRFQLLLPLGFSLVLFYTLKLILKKEIFTNTIIICIIAFSFFHIKEQIMYNIDWFYQKSIIENFKENEEIKNNTTFIIDNKIQDKFAKNRVFRFYEINGMSKNIFFDDKRLFANSIKEIELYKQYKNYDEYNFKSWVYESPKLLLITNNLEFNNLRFKDKIKYFIKLKYFEFFNPQEFKKLVKDLVEIKVK